MWFWLLDASKEIIGEDGRVQKRIQIEEGTESVLPIPSNMIYGGIGHLHAMMWCIVYWNKQ